MPQITVAILASFVLLICSPCRADLKTGFVLIPRTVSARDTKSVLRTGNWREDRFRFAASSHLHAKEDKAALEYCLRRNS
jgi:hypothetical protein